MNLEARACVLVLWRHCTSKTSRFLSICNIDSFFMTDYHVGQRLSLKGQPCTIRYVGAVADKPGEWLGVEWDDHERGRHDGTHDGVKYFECRNPSPHAASFLKPGQVWDKPRTFLQALREKYMPEDTGTTAQAVYFSTKQAEEIGFEKFAQRQSRLQGIHVLVLDRMQIRPSQDPNEIEVIRQSCAHVTDLDLSGNLFESLENIVHLAALFPKLSYLNLSGNRFVVGHDAGNLSTVRTLDLSDMGSTWSDVLSITLSFPNLTKLTAARNDLRMICPGLLPPDVQDLDLSDNSISKLSDLEPLKSCTRLRTLTLKRNRVDTIHAPSINPQPGVLSTTVKVLDLAQNAIRSWSLFDYLLGAYPALNHLIISGNPLYKSLRTADDKPLSTQDGYMLTIARLPQVDMLNYSKITEKERLNSESYYLGQIATELANHPAEQEQEVLRRHPRWEALCDEYGQPSIKRSLKADEVDPNSLVARLLNVTFFMAADTFQDSPQRSWLLEIPKTMSIYSVLGLVGKKLNVMPLKLRLIWETGERDPMAQGTGYAGPEWWDSSDESDNDAIPNVKSVLREVELVPGTRAIGTYVEGAKASIRVGLR